MAASMVNCAKLKQELPGIDPDTPEGNRALKMCLMIGGPDLRKRVAESVSAKAWAMWKDHMVMIFNEYRLDPMSDQANQVLKTHLEAFFFGQEQQIPNYVPPKQ